MFQHSYQYFQRPSYLWRADIEVDALQDSAVKGTEYAQLEINYRRPFRKAVFYFGPD